MGLKINEYPNEALTINDEDFYDVDFWDGTNYQSHKISGATLKTVLKAFMFQGSAGQYMDGTGTPQTFPTIPANTNIYNSDDALTGNRTLTLGAFTLVIKGLTGENQFNGNSQKLSATGGGSASMVLNAISGVRSFIMQTNNVLRWAFRTNGNEAGANSGTNYQIVRYDDAGTLIDVVVEINRATGAIKFNNAYTFPTTDGPAGTYLRTDGAGNLGWGTPVTIEKRIGQDYAYNMSGAGGFTWNAIPTIGTTTLTTLLERWRLQTFAGTGQPDGCFTNFLLPLTYIAGNTIKVTLTTTDNGTGGNIKFWVGLAKPTAGNAFGTDANTEWQSYVHPAQNGFIVETFTLTFAGTDLNPGEPIGILVFRDPADAQDTYTGDAYLNSVSAEQS